MLTGINRVFGIYFLNSQIGFGLDVHAHLAGTIRIIQFLRELNRGIAYLGSIRDMRVNCGFDRNYDI